MSTATSALLHRGGIDDIPNDKEVVRRQGTYSGVDVNDVLSWSKDIGGREEIQAHRALEGRKLPPRHIMSDKTRDVVAFRATVITVPPILLNLELRRYLLVVN